MSRRGITGAGAAALGVTATLIAARLGLRVVFSGKGTCPPSSGQEPPELMTTTGGSIRVVPDSMGAAGASRNSCECAFALGLASGSGLHAREMGISYAPADCGQNEGQTLQAT